MYLKWASGGCVGCNSQRVSLVDKPIYDWIIDLYMGPTYCIENRPTICQKCLEPKEPDRRNLQDCQWACESHPDCVAISWSGADGASGFHNVCYMAINSCTAETNLLPNHKWVIYKAVEPDTSWILRDSCTEDMLDGSERQTGRGTWREGNFGDNAQTGNPHTKMRNVDGFVFVPSKSNIWDPDRKYKCPMGYVWAYTEQWEYAFSGHGAWDRSGDSHMDDHNGEAEDTRPHLYSRCGGDDSIPGCRDENLCGWSADLTYKGDGIKRKKWRFFDSAETTAYLRSDCHHRQRARYGIWDDTDGASIDTKDFAGIVCVSRRMVWTG